ncbi:Hypothetical predicted protein [Olea europaea subsp. europaea]|uniref:Uncharacterized protein n=1 Tax=Olea europaea subsp. europaea TaxID=158383 RepID=A0A8S0R8J5_OLEEU|nr:Hypothetical predicted protein [Olea europaea subsp. europaea]
MGLNAGNDNNVDKTLEAKCRIVKKHFEKCGEKITKGDAYNLFISSKKRKSDKYKTGSIVILAYVLWATDETVYIDLWWLDLIDDLDSFKNNANLGLKFAMKYLDVIPRFVASKITKRLASATIDNVLKSKEPNLMRSIEMKLIVEEDESISHHFEGDDAEYDAEPHHAFHQHFCSASQPPLEAGFDDMMDVPIVERKVKEPHEEPKLEEEVRGKNGGGKGTEVGSGNDMEEQRKEKIFEEGVEKKTIIEVKLPNVEKSIVDFVTLEKHEMDKNKFSHHM